MFLFDLSNIFNTGSIVLLSGLGVCLLAQLIFYRKTMAVPYRYLKSTADRHDRAQAIRPPVSVIVYTRKRYEAPELFLPLFLEQEYPEYEVIVVYDGINDQSLSKLYNLKQKYPHLYYTGIPENTKGLSRRKLGLMLGIKAARHETLLFTTADSYPESKNWISLMSRHFSDRKKLVLGLSARKGGKGLISRFCDYDYLFYQLQELSLAISGKPYAGNGSNMGYRKEVFYGEKSFVRYSFINPGEDDLFVNQVATGANTSVEFSPGSLIFTEMAGRDGFRRRKADRTLTKRYYKNGSFSLLRFEQLSRLGFYLFFVACTIYGLPDISLLSAACLLFLIRFLLQWFVINKTMASLKLGKFHITLFLFDLIQPFVDFWYFLRYRMGKRKRKKMRL